MCRNFYFHIGTRLVIYKSLSFQKKIVVFFLNPLCRVLRVYYFRGVYLVILVLETVLV